MTNILATKATLYASKEGSLRDEWGIHTQCKRINLQRAKTIDYMIIIRDGKIEDVAKVYGAEPEPARWGWGDNPIDRVSFICGPRVPAEIEALIGTPVEWKGKAPNVYYTLDDDGALVKA